MTGSEQLRLIRKADAWEQAEGLRIQMRAAYLAARRSPYPALAASSRLQYSSAARSAGGHRRGLAALFESIVRTVEDCNA